MQVFHLNKNDLQDQSVDPHLGVCARGMALLRIVIRTTTYHIMLHCRRLSHLSFLRYTGAVLPARLSRPLWEEKCGAAKSEVLQHVKHHRNHPHSSFIHIQDSFHTSRSQTLSSRASMAILCEVHP